MSVLNTDEAITSIYNLLFMKFIPSALILIALLHVGCDNDNCTTGSGVTGTLEEDINFFQGLSNSTLVDIVLVADTLLPWQAQLKGDDNLLTVIDLDIEDNVLEVRHDESCIMTTQALELTLLDLQLGPIVNSGSGDISGVTGLSDPVITNSGSGDIDLNNILYSGPIGITNSGSGDVDTEGINAEAVTVVNSGSGDVYVTAVENLTVTISGSGDVYYKGMPTITPVVSGSGELIDNN